MSSLRPFLRPAATGLAALSVGYTWTVGQSGLASTNRNLCDLWQSLGFWKYDACEFQYWLLVLWALLSIAAAIYLLSEVFRFILAVKLRRVRLSMLWVTAAFFAIGFVTTAYFIVRDYRGAGSAQTLRDQQTIQPEAQPAASTLARQIVIRPPIHQYSYLWDPPTGIQMVTKPRLAPDENEPLGTRLPVLWLKNLGPEVPGEITIQWNLKLPSAPDDLFLAAPRMKMFNPHRKNGMVCWEMEDPTPPKSLRSACVPVATQATSKIDFPAPGKENDKFFPVAVPSQIWAAVEIYAAANVHGMRGFPSIAIPLEVAVSWTVPQPGETLAKFNCVFFKMGGETGVGAVQTYPPALRLEGSFNIEASKT